MQKICSQCRVSKHIDLFINKQTGKETKNCQSCRNHHLKSTMKRNGGKFYGDARRNSNFKALYGITVEDYNRLLNTQGGKCLICQEVPKEGEKKLSIDHCHDTNKIRGLLCNRCNQGLGYFKHDTTLLEEAIKYLRP